MEMRIIRNTAPEDLPDVWRIYARARERMAEEGNNGQWRPGGPPSELVLKDINEGHHYVVAERGRIIGAFSYIPGEDPTYRIIEGEGWLNDRPYGTIHRIAAEERGMHLFADVLAFCSERCPDVRIDTHEKNRTMRAVLAKHGFRECGVIRLADGSPRIAYQKSFDEGGRGFDSAHGKGAEL